MATMVIAPSLGDGRANDVVPLRPSGQRSDGPTFDHGPPPGQGPFPRSWSLTAEMRRLTRLAERFARTNLNVLILGETGVGKEEMARGIHALSSRAAKPFLAINCAGLSETLAESLLFGHVRGSFTGATENREGLLAAAQGGTVFLDELGEMHPAVQSKLLRAIDRCEVTPLGSARIQRVDVRFVAATNSALLRSPDRRSSGFRDDLFFRLGAATLIVPPLRERREEIVPLAESLLGHAARFGGGPSRLSPAARAALERYPWPGNVRELKSVIDCARALCDEDEIQIEHLIFKDGSWNDGGPAGTMVDPQTELSDVARGRPLSRLEAAEKKRMLEALHLFAGNQSRAAEHLGIPRRTFVAKLQRYGIPRPNRRNARASDAPG